MQTFFEAYMAKFQEQDHTSTAPTSDIPINNHLTLSSSSLSYSDKSRQDELDPTGPRRVISKG